MKNAFLENLRKWFVFPHRKWFLALYLNADFPLERGSIIDIETTGLNPRYGYPYIPRCHVITLGIYQGNLIRIYQLIKPSYIKFLATCRKIIQKTPAPRYAYAAHFEQSFLGVLNGWQDLTQYEEMRSDWWGGEPSFRRFSLVDVTRNPCPKREDWDIDGSEVPATWEKWLKTGKVELLGEIAYHNYIDLLRERQLV